MQELCICEVCHKEYNYKRGTGCSKQICSSCRQKYRKKLFKHFSVLYMGGKCQKCGYNKCEEALVFHHLDPSKKDFGIGRNYNKKWETIKNELDKCAMLCSNCHSEEHARGHLPLETYKKYITPQEEIRNQAKKKKMNKQKELECMAKKYNTTPEALKTVRFGGRKVERPSKEVFYKEYEEVNHNKSALARKYGVTEQSIRKWFASYEKVGI